MNRTGRAWRLVVKYMFKEIKAFVKDQDVAQLRVAHSSCCKLAIVVRSQWPSLVLSLLVQTGYGRAMLDFYTRMLRQQALVVADGVPLLRATRCLSHPTRKDRAAGEKEAVSRVTGRM